MGINTLVSQISSDLNDSEQGYAFSNWTQAQIAVWLLEGAYMVYDKRPDLFMKRVTVKVATCSVLQDVCECTTLRRVIGQVTESGRLLRPLRKRDMEMTFRWSAPTCRRPSRRRGDPFPLESYLIDTVSNALYLWPEVPPNEDVWVDVECSHRPTEEDLASGAATIPSGALVAVKQWALWRAKSVDMEVSPAMYQAAQVHYKAFFEVLGITTVDNSDSVRQREIK